MFENYIYILSALLLSSSYQISRDTGSVPFSSIFGILFFSALFVLAMKLIFSRLEKLRLEGSHMEADRKFGQTLTRLSVLSVVLFTANVYLFDLKQMMSGFTLFVWFPSMGEMAVVLVFVAYQVILWSLAYRAYVGHSRLSLSRKEYVLSNVSFLAPVLLPWFMFTFIPDIVHLLPFETPGKFLDSDIGEIVYYVTFFATALITGPMLIVRFWGCRSLSRGPKRTLIEGMINKAGISYADICLWPAFGGRMVTAGVMGVMGRFRYILVTPALLDYLSDEELDSVIAHEIGHVKKSHILLYLLIFSGFMVLATIIVDPLVLALISFKPIGMMLLKAGEGGSVFISAVTGIILILALMIYLRFFFGYFMRNFERQADVYVYSLMDDATHLIRTFFKIVRLSGQHPDKPNWHHFSISRRIRYLKRCEEDRSYVERQDRKVGRMLTVFVVGLFTFSILAYSIHFGKLNRIMDGYYKERLYSMVMDNPLENYVIYDMLAMVYYDAGDFEEAANVYEKSISVNPVNVYALNNLAWLYATCKDKGFRDLEKAVLLAEKAAGQERSSHVLDTLAECYFLLGRFKEAVALSEEALENVTGDSGHYRSQLKRFKAGIQR